MLLPRADSYPPGITVDRLKLLERKPRFVFGFGARLGAEKRKDNRGLTITIHLFLILEHYGQRGDDPGFNSFIRVSSCYPISTRKSRSE
jgi:hypothetical protein